MNEQERRSQERAEVIQRMPRERRAPAKAPSSSKASSFGRARHDFATSDELVGQWRELDCVLAWRQGLRCDQSRECGDLCGGDDRSGGGHLLRSHYRWSRGHVVRGDERGGRCRWGDCAGAAGEYGRGDRRRHQVVALLVFVRNPPTVFRLWCRELKAFYA